MRYYKFLAGTLLILMVITSTTQAASLLIKCGVPGAKVSIDSVEKGQADNQGMVFIENLAQGIHEVVITKNGYRTFREKVEVSGTVTAIKQVKLVKELGEDSDEAPDGQAGSILIQSNQGGSEVTVDSKIWGKTDENGSAFIDDIEPGEHTITLSKDGFAPQTKKIIVKELTAQLKVTLEKTGVDAAAAGGEGKIMIQSDVPNAQVLIDEAVIGETDKKGMAYIEGIPLGPHSITVSKNGYESFTKAINLHNTLTMTIEAELAMKDESLPEIMLISPAATRGIKAIVKESTVPVVGLARDDNGVASVSVNGVGAILDTPTARELEDFPGNTVKFTVVIPVNQGDNSLTIAVLDIGGNRSSQSIIVTREAVEQAQDLASLEMKCYALVVGIDKYQFWNPLNNPVFDIKTIAEDLENDYEFEVQLLLNPTKTDIQRAIISYYEMKFNDNDQLLIVFAGHGHFDDKTEIGYFIPVDGKKSIDDPFSDSYLGYPNLQQTINNIPSKHILLVLDACFGGTINRQIASRGDDENAGGTIPKSEFIKRKLRYKTRMIMTSGGKEYVSDGRRGHHSPFMGKFLEGLRSYGGQDGILTVEELNANYMEHVEKQVQYFPF